MDNNSTGNILRYRGERRLNPIELERSYELKIACDNALSAINPNINIPQEAIDASIPMGYNQNVQPQLGYFANKSDHGRQNPDLANKLRQELDRIYSANQSTTPTTDEQSFTGAQNSIQNTPLAEWFKHAA